MRNVTVCLDRWSISANTVGRATSRTNDEAIRREENEMGEVFRSFCCNLTLLSTYSFIISNFQNLIDVFRLRLVMAVECRLLKLLR